MASQNPPSPSYVQSQEHPLSHNAASTDRFSREKQGGLKSPKTITILGNSEVLIKKNQTGNGKQKTG
jgi:hypothetical protein